MHTKTKRSGKGLSIPAALGFGTAASIIVTIAGAVIVTWLLAGERIGENKLTSMIILIQIAAAIAGGATATTLTNSKRLLVSMLSGTCYFLVLIALTALVFDGQYQGVGWSALAIEGCSAIIAVLPTRKQALHRKRKRSYR